MNGFLTTNGHLLESRLHLSLVLMAYLYKKSDLFTFG